MKKLFVRFNSESRFQNMNRLYALLPLLILFGCISDRQSNQDATASIDTKYTETGIAMNSIKNSFLYSEPYELKLKINQLENDMYDFVISMRLNNNSYYVSPNAKRDFTGKFTILIDDTNKMEPVSDLVETPRSVEEFDPHPFVNGNVNWVRKNTIYNQKLQRTSSKDFVITGLIQFTIEPRCTLEKIPFSIKYSEGEMKVEIDKC